MRPMKFKILCPTNDSMLPGRKNFIAFLLSLSKDYKRGGYVGDKSIYKRFFAAGQLTSPLPFS